tara:strand:+ start:184 stop:885 length:702 start_codon:yes stop_codon:yes gene_type:complete
MKKILVTGASRGIGLELCRQLLEENHQVIGTYREEKSAVPLFGLAKEAAQLDLVCLDVNSTESINHAFQAIKQKFSSLDQVFNNAGILDWSSLSEVTVEAFRNIYETNVIGVFQVSREARMLLQNGKDPLIVNLSSRLGSITLRGNTQLGGAIAYQCSKTALNMLTKQTSIDYQEYGIRVISMSPGWVKTDMGGADAKYEVSESVRLLLSRVKELPTETSGVFLGEDGESIPW